MTISNYICELLYRYDCIIVPNFGAILTNRTSAKLVSDDHIFYPPNKQLSFNQQIINNDGLLANHISVSEKITYEAAVAKVEVFVNELKVELQVNKTLSLNEIGVFSLNTEGNIEFEPEHDNNYLIEAFGLSSFKTTNVVRQEQKEETPVLVEEEIETAVEVEEEEKSTRYGYLKIAAGFALLLGVGGFIAKNYIDYNNIKEYNLVEEFKGIEMANEEIQSASFALDILSPLPSVSVSINKKEEVIKNFHVIAGAFREFPNAENKIKQLEAKGFEANYIGENRYGLHQVAYSSFSSRREAVNALNKIKRTENTSAWLLISK